MLCKLKLVGKGARLYLWPAAAGNTIIMGFAAGGGIIEALLLGLSLCCLASFGFLVNDLCDRPVDKVNSAGRLEGASPSLIRMAWASSAGFLFAGLSLALIVGSSSLFLSFWIAVGLILYSAAIRRVLLAANLLSALLGTAPLWAPFILWRDHSLSLAPSLFLGVYLMFVAREIILDIKDERGDSFAGRHTFATIYGSRIAGFLASAASIAAGLVFLGIAVRASSTVPAVQAILLWLNLLMFVVLVVAPALRVTLSPLGTSRGMVNYILSSRWAMVALPLVLGLVLLVGK